MLPNMVTFISVLTLTKVVGSNTGDWLLHRPVHTHINKKSANSSDVESIEYVTSGRVRAGGEELNACFFYVSNPVFILPISLLCQHWPSSETTAVTALGTALHCQLHYHSITTFVVQCMS